MASSISTIGLVAAFAIALPAFADEPPSWQPFEKCSANGQFCAQVKPVRGSSGSPWEAKYSLRVVDREGSTVWSSSYSYDGYADGYLSNDGAYFVYVDFWYEPFAPVVTIYSKEEQRSLTGAEFSIRDEDLLQTVSHFVWLDQEREPVRFIDSKRLSIVTLDHRTHTIDLPTGTLEHE